MTTSYMSAFVLYASRELEIVDRIFPEHRIFGRTSRHLLLSPTACDLLAIVLPGISPPWSCDILISLQRGIELHRDTYRNEERTKISDERGGDWDRQEGEKRSVGERHRRSEGGLSVLFARRAVIEYRYSQSRGACRRADAKINEPITEVDSRLLCLCVRHASASYMCAAC